MDKQPISDDQELAKVLAGVTNDDTMNAAAAAPSVPDPSQPADGTSMPTPNEPVVPEVEMPAPAPAMPEPSFNVPAGDSNLDSIKSDALNELRPLVDKLNVSPEEKFDTYLLLLRSTDDKELVAPAHAAAKEITDEARRAQALLDIIKEIDFLSQPQTPQQ